MVFASFFIWELVVWQEDIKENSMRKKKQLVFFILWIGSVIVGFVTKYWKLILLISILLILWIKYHKSIIDFFKELIDKRYIKKLKNESKLYIEIEKNLNHQYYFEELKPFFDYYHVKNKSELETCNIDDYLLITIDRKYQDLYLYKKKYDKLYQSYKEYLKKYEALKIYIDEQECRMIHTSLSKYMKYQNKIYENLKMKRFYEFKVVIYVNYSSRKGKIRKSIYKCYNKDKFKEIFLKYLEMKKTKSYYQVSARIERAKMGDSIRYDVLKRDKYRCCICGRSMKDGIRLEVDHIIPVSKGGKPK